MNCDAMGLLDRITFRKQGAEPPEALDLTERGEIRIVWPGGQEVVVPALDMRDACPCAGCVEEGTGRKLLDRATLPAGVRVKGIEPVGNYAVKFQWSDGHDTGIYSWSYLRDVAPPRS